MGTKGRDLALYLYFAMALGGMAGRLVGFPAMPFLLLTILLAGLIVAYYLFSVPKAEKHSREIGLKGVILLPLWRRWAGFLCFTAKYKITGRYKQAFEVHVRLPAGKGPKEFLALLDADLNLARAKLPGSLFIWETSAPLPGTIRALVRQGKERGTAFWKEGRWPFLRFPGTGLDLRKGRVRHGAILIAERKGNVD